MSHNCNSRLCVTPHYFDCQCGICPGCHEVHEWRDWAVYPECSSCEAEMIEELQPLLDEYPARHEPSGETALAQIPEGMLPALTVWGQGTLLNEIRGGYENE